MKLCLRKFDNISYGSNCYLGSDLWAFGIVLYEIATFGRLPYPGLENMEVAELVMNEDYRMDEPRGCPLVLHSDAQM